MLLFYINRTYARVSTCPHNPTQFDLIFDTLTPKPQNPKTPISTKIYGSILNSIIKYKVKNEICFKPLHEQG